MKSRVTSSLSRRCVHGNALRGLHAAICRCPEPVSKWIERLQFYLNFPAIEGAPLIALRGFQRVHLDRGATQKVHFHLSPRDLDMVTENGDPIIARVTTPSVSEEDSRTPVRQV
jgi:hypothetical protein